MKDHPGLAGANSLKLINVVDHVAALTVVHFGRHLDANFGGARSQRVICFSSFDTRKKHVRETPKSQSCTRRSAYAVPPRGVS